MSGLRAGLRQCVVLCANCHRRDEAIKRNEWRLALRH
jgi:hypothetical protein